MNNSLLTSMGMAKDVIEKNSSFFISSHINPDGDSIGSSLGLALALLKLDKKVVILKNDNIPKDYRFLPATDLYKEDIDSDHEIDVFICLDSSDENRLGNNKKYLERSKLIINIDHHISNTSFGHINIIDPDAAATAEIIYEFIKYLNIELDKDISKCLYTAISTDTGSFKYRSTSSKTHRIIASLLDTGIDNEQININIYENMGLNRANLFIEALNSMEIYYNGKLVVVKVSQEMLKKTGSDWEDTEGIVSFIRKIDTVEVACLLKEMDINQIKASVRSKNYVNVSELCKQFEGGGHIRAAGCSFNSSIEEAKELIIKSLKRDLGD